MTPNLYNSHQYIPVTGNDDQFLFTENHKKEDFTVNWNNTFKKIPNQQKIY